MVTSSKSKFSQILIINLVILNTNLNTGRVGTMTYCNIVEETLKPLNHSSGENMSKFYKLYLHKLFALPHTQPKIVQERREREREREM